MNPMTAGRKVADRRVWVASLLILAIIGSMIFAGVKHWQRLDESTVEAPALYVAHPNEVRAVLDSLSDPKVRRLVESAQEQSDLAAMEGLYQSALARIPDVQDPERWGILYLLGRTLLRSKKANEADSMLLAAHESALRYQPADSTAVYATSVHAGWVYRVRQDPTKALSAATKAAELLERPGKRPPQERSQEYGEVGILLAELNQADRAEPLLLKSLNNPALTDLDNTHARALLRLAKIRFERGDTPQSVDFLERSLAAWEDPQRTDIDLIVEARCQLAQMYIANEQPERAKQQFERAMRDYELIGETRKRAAVMGLLGGLLLAQHDYPRARALLGESYEIVKEVTYPRRPHIALKYGETLVALKAYAEAEAPLLAALNEFDSRLSEPVSAAFAAGKLGSARFKDGRPCEAKSAFLRAQGLLDRASAEELATLSDEFIAALGQAVAETGEACKV